MGQDTEELKREIEDTRADMSETLDAIGDRVSPGRIVQRRKNRVSASIQDLRYRVMGTAEDSREGLSEKAHEATDAVKHTPDAISSGTQGSPLVAGALAFGFGFLIAAAFSPTNTEKRASAKVMDKLEPAKEQLMDSAKEMAEHLKEPAKAAAMEIKDTATESASTVASTARDAAEPMMQHGSGSSGTGMTEPPSTI